jgi:hypothetical protein
MDFQGWLLGKYPKYMLHRRRNMSKVKYVLGWVLVLVMMAIPAISVGAASPAQTAVIEGTVQSCEATTDSFTGDPVVVCVVNLTTGETLTVRLSVSDAVAKGLAVLNEDGSVTIIAIAGQGVMIEEYMLLVDPCEVPAGDNHPIAKIMANYFCENLGTTPDILQSLHEDGFGFGEIAQACFMAVKLDGTGSLCEEILYAKKSGDYSNLTLPDGVTVTNWGQLRKTVLDGESANPGSIVSEDAKNKEKSNGHSGDEHGKDKK